MIVRWRRARFLSAALPASHDPALSGSFVFEAIFRVISQSFQVKTSEKTPIWRVSDVNQDKIGEVARQRD
jgi:hypothetical protein